MFRFSMREMILLTIILCQCFALISSNVYLRNRIADLKIENSCRYQAWHSKILSDLLEIEFGCTISIEGDGIHMELPDGSTGIAPRPNEDHIEIGPPVRVIWQSENAMSRIGAGHGP